MKGWMWMPRVLALIRKVLRSALLLLGLLATGRMVLAQNLEILPVRHRPAQELVEVLRPMLGAGESLSAYQDQIIVRASPSTVNNLKQILQQIDQPARQYLVQWQITGQQQTSREQLSGGVVINSDGRQLGGQIGGTVLSTQNNRGDGFSQQVRVLEGNSAWIALNQQVPLQVRQTTVTPYGVVSSSGSQYVSFTSGLAVTPRALGRGQQVQLALAPQRSTRSHSPAYNMQQGLANPAEQVSQVTTTMIVNLGEWVEIGSIAEATQRNERAVLSSSDARGQGGQRLMLRVDAVGTESISGK